MERTEIVSLETLNGGAVVERFNIALQEVLDNIIDPNTVATKERSIVLKITLKPDEDRELCAVKITSEAKLAPIAPLGTHFFIGMKGGKGVACERSIRQSDMFAEVPLPKNVTPIDKAKEASK